MVKFLFTVRDTRIFPGSLFFRFLKSEFQMFFMLSVCFWFKVKKKKSESQGHNRLLIIFYLICSVIIKVTPMFYSS